MMKESEIFIALFFSCSLLLRPLPPLLSSPAPPAVIDVSRANEAEKIQQQISMVI